MSGILKNNKRQINELNGTDGKNIEKYLESRDSRRRRFSRLREFFGLCGYEYAPAYYLLKRENSKNL